jgi:hypothetical protein
MMTTNREEIVFLTAAMFRYKIYIVNILLFLQQASESIVARLYFKLLTITVFEIQNTTRSKKVVCQMINCSLRSVRMRLSLLSSVALQKWC